MRNTIGVIADDLTGANDSGVQLSEKGINTSVFFDIPQSKDKLDEGVVIDTDSRALSKKEAIYTTKQASKFLKKMKYEHIYKKMDSTLRGYIGAELNVLNDVFNPEFIIIAPAFPAYGRTTKNGIHYVHNKKLAETEASEDPKHPVMDSYIPGIIEKEIGQRVGILTVNDVASSGFQDKINNFNEKGIKYIVCDAEVQDDLKRLAEKMISISENIIWAGSAGLAEVIPEALGINYNVDSDYEGYSKRVMSICGSLSEVTKKQLEYAIKQTGITSVELDTSKMFADNWKIDKKKYIEECLEGLKNKHDIVLYVPSHECIRKEVRIIADNLQLSKNQVGKLISQSIGEIVKDVVEQCSDLSGFVLTGGDTAKETSRILGGSGFRLIKQVEAGIPLGTLIGPEKEYTVVTKAGAFGKIDSIYKAMQELKGGLK